jgi:apolipoprotein N-acyltransferase
MTRLSQLSLWRAGLLAALLGAMGVLAFSPYECWPAALIALVALLGLTLNRSPGQAATLAFAWGMGFFGCGLGWIYHCIEQFGGLPRVFGVLLMLLLIAYLALYPALFAALLARLFPRPTAARLLLAAPALWQLTEWFRSTLLSGFPWLQWGYTQINGPLAGLAPLGGVNLITWVLIALSGLGCWVWFNQRWSMLWLLPLGLLLSYPLRDYPWVQPLPERTTTVALVQGNIAQSLKWQPEQLQATLQRYWQLTAPLLTEAKVVIWPEMAIPATDLSQQAFLKNLAQHLNPHQSLITGISHQGSADDYFNTLLVLTGSPVGETTPYRYYHKHHLVPFGEFVPLASLLRPLAPLFNLPMSSFGRGSYQQPPLLAADRQFTPAICYEIILGEQIRANFSNATDFLLTVSNDAWFGDTNGPWQHLQMAQMRALELGRPLLRATNTGITAIVEPQGEITARLPQFAPGVLQATFIPTTGLTPYARWGAALVWLLSTVSFITACCLALFRPKSSSL